jgi:MoxR-like ATPase
LAPFISYGASPRASINLILAARALAFVRGRTYALPQDVRDLAPDVMRHRLVLSYEALADNVSPDDLLNRILNAVPMPEAPLHERHRAPVAYQEHSNT